MCPRRLAVVVQARRGVASRRGRSPELSQPLVTPALLAAGIAAVIHRPHDVKLGPQLPFAAAGARLVDDALEITWRPLRRLFRVHPFGQSFEDLGGKAGSLARSGDFHDLSVSLAGNGRGVSRVLSKKTELHVPLCALQVWGHEIREVVCSSLAPWCYVMNMEAAGKGKRGMGNSRALPAHLLRAVVARAPKRKEPRCPCRINKAERKSPSHPISPRSPRPESRERCPKSPGRRRELRRCLRTPDRDPSQPPPDESGTA